MTDSSSSPDSCDSSLIPFYSPCLVCSTPTRVMHLGVGCRACAVFFRRSKRRIKPYRCRSGTLDCVVERDEKTACKRCRFTRMIQVMRDMKIIELHEVQRPIIVRPTMHIIERFRIAYEKFTRECIVAELAQHFHGNEQFLHHERQMKWEMMTLESMMCAGYTTILSLFSLIDNVFDEFKTFTNDTQRRIVVSMVSNCATLEETFRTSIRFEGEEDKFCIGYSMYLDRRDFTHLFRGISKGDIKTAISIMKENYVIKSQCRTILAMSPIDEIEHIAALGIGLWDPDNAISEDSAEIFAQRRCNILKDLHIYYKDIRGYDDYASRIGRLYHLIMIMKSTATRLSENTEMLRLTGIIDEEALIKRLQAISIPNSSKIEFPKS